MLALGIRYLNGFAAACDVEARQPGAERAEWPPHPARVFMALAAAHFTTGSEPAERDALLWLETQPPPCIKASPAAQRAIVMHYVPVNDKAGDTSKPPTAIIPSVPQLARDRQPRTFARAWLDEDIVYFVWPEAEPQERIVLALRSLAAKVTRIGHSTSQVQVWIAAPGESGEVNWVPDDERAELQLRVVGPGALEDLERRYNADAVKEWESLVLAAEESDNPKAQRAAKKRLKRAFGNQPPPRIGPQISLYQGYARPLQGTAATNVTGSVFSPYLVVFSLERRSGPFRRLGLRSVAQVTQRWHEALVSQANDMPGHVREVISGHDVKSRPLEAPHVALMPLPFAGDPHSDGHLLGLAAALPKELTAEARRQVLQVLGRVTELKLGWLGVWALVRELRDRPPWNLRSEVWTALPEGAKQWATVTPIAFDRHPKAKARSAYDSEVAEMIANACTATGLLQPREVIVTHVSAHFGVPPAFEFPLLQRKEGGTRRHTHAILVFDQPVVGPVLIGAGRYRGYGVCRPLGRG